MEYIVKTPQGKFIIRENTDINKGIKVFTTGNKPYTATTKVEWWDLDGVYDFLANVDADQCKAA